MTTMTIDNDVLKKVDTLIAFASIVSLCILFYLVGLAIFMYFLAFVFILLLNDFNMFDVLYDMLVALVALCYL